LNKRNLLAVQLHSCSLARIVEALKPVRLCARQAGGELKAHKQKRPGQTMTWPFGRSRPQQIAVSRSYLPVFPIGGVTTSLCCAQAPSPKAVTITATIMIVFNSFNLSRLLSPQVAPVCLGREQRGSNAFSQFF